MHIQARRIFRMALTPALAVAVSYGMALPSPYYAPLYAFFLGGVLRKTLGIKQLLGLLILMTIALGSGLLLIPVLLHLQGTALLLVLVGLYFSTYLTVNLHKAMPGMYFAMGLTMVSAIGTTNSSSGASMVQSMVTGMAIAVICHLIISFFFPEDPPVLAKREPAEDSPSQQESPAPDIINAVESNWIAIRSTLIIFPAYLVLLSNPMAYTSIIVKSITLSRQVSTMDTKRAGSELIGSTFVGGVLAVVFWWALSIWPHLWMFVLWMSIAGLYIAGKFFQLIPTRFSPSFWLDVAITLVIMLGPAVADSATGNDVYKAFFVRAVLLILVSIYALMAVRFLEYLKPHFRKRVNVI